jgi:hypothetical protein
MKEVRHVTDKEEIFRCGSLLNSIVRICASEIVISQKCKLTALPHHFHSGMGYYYSLATTLGRTTFPFTFSNYVCQHLHFKPSHSSILLYCCEFEKCQKNCSVF